jgi:orotidine-5'-phosphate decarboxylase
VTVTTATSYVARLGARIRSVGSVLCLGLDPDPDDLPVRFSRDIAGVERYVRLLVDVAGPYAAAVKPNLAFWEALGPDGMAALERLRADLPADVPVIVDAKRGDIGSTAARQAVAIVQRLAADAVTLNPYLGRDGIDPFLERGAFGYILCRTSNPSARDLQDVPVRSVGGTEPFHLAVARLVAQWEEATPGRLGLVIGATDVTPAPAIREAAPALPFLVPGVGAQRGDAAAPLDWGPATAGDAGTAPAGGLVVNVSRGIARVPDGADAEASIDGAARDWAARLRVLA